MVQKIRWYIPAFLLSVAMSYAMEQKVTMPERVEETFYSMMESEDAALEWVVHFIDGTFEKCKKALISNSALMYKKLMTEKRLHKNNRDEGI